MWTASFYLALLDRRLLFLWLLIQQIVYSKLYKYNVSKDLDCHLTVITVIEADGIEILEDIIIIGDTNFMVYSACWDGKFLNLLGAG